MSWSNWSSVQFCRRKAVAGHFLFWLGFTNEKDDHVKRSLTNKQFGFAKRFKKEVFEYLVQDNLQENSSCQGFRDLVDEDWGKALDDEREHSFKNEKMEKTSDLNPDEDIGSTEHKKSFICVHDSSTKFFVAVDLKGNFLQVP